MEYKIIGTGSTGNEKWEPIKDFEDKYEISSLGRIRNKLTNKILKMTNKNGDYFRIILYNKNKKKSCYIHRLVAETFIPNPQNYHYVNHKDLNKQNNKVENLEWCTQSYNTIHAIKNGVPILSGINKYNKTKGFKKYGYIYQYDLKGKFIRKYKTIEEAYSKTKVCKRNILQVMNHEEGRKQAGNYIWKCEREVMRNEI